jgi:6,7-dimethyl-8-ribityllumazine synthase
MSTTSYEGSLSAAGMKFGLVNSRFNTFITERLVEGATDCLVRHGADASAIELVRVPGTWELPLAVKWMLDSRRYDAIIALGCVIRGGTPHFEYVASEVTKGCANLSLAAGVPVTLGVLTTDSIEQAIERAGTKHGNKGWESALAAIEMVALRRGLEAAQWAIGDKHANSR